MNGKIDDILSQLRTNGLSSGRRIDVAELPSAEAVPQRELVGLSAPDVASLSALITSSREIMPTNSRPGPITGKCES
jgi:hypothetical protein